MKSNLLKLTALFILSFTFGLSIGFGQTTFGSQEIISNQAQGANAVYACDIDGDGDFDVLSSSQADNKIAWYENTDGNGNFGDQQIISDIAEGASSVYACDIDGDGDIDVLSASSSESDIDQIAWYENTDGEGTFGPIQIISSLLNYACYVYAYDIDGDGDNDVLSASFNDGKIAWYENTDGNGLFGEQQIIGYISSPTSVYACDINNDGNKDVLASAHGSNEIVWYQYIGDGTFGEKQVITTLAGHARAVYASDIDGDGDNDVVSACWDDGKVAWYENLDDGAFGDEQIIVTDPDGGRLSVYACDLDNDGDNDIVSASYHDHKIAWHENTNGEGAFGEEQIITSSANYAYSVYACDIDGDGDNDVLSASYGDNKIAWYKNRIITSIDKLYENNISIYPNPTSGLAKLEGASLDILQLTVYDNTGKTIIQKLEIQANEQIDLSAFESGIYVIRIQTVNEVFTSKIVKK